ncbi:hypothetical protein CBM2600_B10711 [Cupriavidus taiwanensis]|nr:hypothetical protein CBM2600_B10711 [Cupriavidus taiwanensis]
MCRRCCRSRICDCQHSFSLKAGGGGCERVRVDAGNFVDAPALSHAPLPKRKKEANRRKGEVLWARPRQRRASAATHSVPEQHT